MRRIQAVRSGIGAKIKVFGRDTHTSDFVSGCSSVSTKEVECTWDDSEPDECLSLDPSNDAKCIHNELRLDYIRVLV